MKTQRELEEQVERLKQDLLEIFVFLYDEDFEKEGSDIIESIFKREGWKW